MNNLKDIHNLVWHAHEPTALFYQDFNEQFEGYTQHRNGAPSRSHRCFIRISMNNLKDIHNQGLIGNSTCTVVLSGFQ